MPDKKPGHTESIAQMPDKVPSVTAILLCYNTEKYVAAALQSVLEQDCAPMQLIVSDDASTDKTVDVVQNILKNHGGQYDVEFLRRTTNSGSKSGHLNSVFPLVKGEIIVSFDDDDISDPCRIRRIQEAFASNPDAYAVYSSFSIIDETGHPRGAGKAPHPPAGMSARTWFARVDSYAAGMTLSIRREVTEKFGKLDPSIHEDIVLPFRASLLGDVIYIDEALVQARRHGASLTRNFADTESLKNYRVRFAQGIARAKQHRESRLSDIQTAAKLMPERAPGLIQLKKTVMESIATAESTAGLVSPSPLTRLKALLHLWRTDAYPDERARQVFIALAPRLYLLYKRNSQRS